MGTHLPLPQRGTVPQFSAHICCGQTAEWIKMPVSIELGLDPDDFVLDGDPAPPPQKGAKLPKFSDHVYCGQTATWINMALGMEVGLSPSPQKGGRTTPPIFGQFLLWPNDWMHQDATWYGGGPRPRRHCVRWGPSSPLQKGAEPFSLIFGPCLLWPKG